jgi:hypothetical protein
MKKQVGDQLMRSEIDGTDIMQSEQFLYIEGAEIFKSLLSKENQHIYNNQVLNYGWNHLESPRPEFCHSFS